MCAAWQLTPPQKLVALKREAANTEKRLKSEVAELMSKLTSKERELQYTLVQKVRAWWG